MDSKEWKKTAGNMLHALANGRIAEERYLKANVNMIRAALSGKGPDGTKNDPTRSAKTVFNIAAVHIPAFCNHGYKNTYDLKQENKLGANQPSQKRIAVDMALPPTDHEKIYFGAVELNGCGVRFYGDICMVLTVTSNDTVILDRNSYDIQREPLNLETKSDEDKAQEISGTWKDDLATIATIKVLEGQPVTTRRITTGIISDRLLTDEDYIEVLRERSFGKDDLEETRISASEVAKQEHIGNRLMVGPTPDWASLLWRHQHRQAARALSKHNVKLKTVTHSGREK